MDIASLLGDQKVELTCPGCNHEFEVYAKNVFKKNSKVTCPKCDSEITIENSESLREVEKSLKDLEKTLKSFGK